MHPTLVPLRTRAELTALLKLTRDHPDGASPAVADGGWYCGLVQHGVYNVLYTHLFGSAATVANALRKVAFDSVVHVPFVVFPVYYAYKHTFYDGDGAMAGLQRYSTEAVDMCGKYYSIWVPANMLMFTVVPPPLRIGFAASVSLAWLTVVSYLTHLTTSSSVASSSTSSSLSNRGTSEKEAFDARA